MINRISLKVAPMLAVVIASSFFLAPANAVAGWAEDSYCSMKNIKDGSCVKGDLLLVPSPHLMLRFCDFDSKIVPLAKGNASDISSGAICVYRGSERKARPTKGQ